MSRIDQDLVSHDAVEITGTSALYGADIPLKSIPDNVGVMDAVCHFATAPAGGSTVEVSLYGGAAANPTTKTQTLFSGTVAELAAALKNGEFRTMIFPGALKAFNRIGITPATAMTAGCNLTSFLTPKLA